jgi:hypothetical protein
MTHDANVMHVMMPSKCTHAGAPSKSEGEIIQPDCSVIFSTLSTMTAASRFSKMMDT